MKQDASLILTINGGSSSIKFSLYRMHASLTQILTGQITNIGMPESTMHIQINGKQERLPMRVANYEQGADVIINMLKERTSDGEIKVIGHRIVYGMYRPYPEIITPELIAALRKFNDYDPEHMPGEIALIEAFEKYLPSIVQVACFDTSFHAQMPQVAKWVSIPRRFSTKGIRRYGFHGLSYAYLMEALHDIAGHEVASGKIILAHLGNGASLAAVKAGQCLDTSMGFTPTSGIPMGTRSGDLDPGVAWYLMQSEKLSANQFNHLTNHESGLLGISETSSDMQELLRIQSTDTRAAEAIEFFCYQIRKWIGSFAAVLGGVDTLIFSGGIGEHAPEVRAQICENLQFLGIEIDEARNQKNEGTISTDTSAVCVRVIATNEELMIAKLVERVIAKV